MNDIRMTEARAACDRSLKAAERKTRKLLRLCTVGALDKDPEFQSLRQQEKAIRRQIHKARLNVSKKRTKIDRLNRDLLETQAGYRTAIEIDKTASIELQKLAHGQETRRREAEQRALVQLGLAMPPQVSSIVVPGDDELSNWRNNHE